MTNSSNPTPRRIRDLTNEEITSLLLDTEPYLSCDACFADLDHYVEQLRLDPNHRDVAMQVHLAACDACAEEAEALAELVGHDAP
jgi:hypothetical protein